jgi:glycine oxidase
MKVLVIGAGVAGLSCALELAEAGVSVEVIDRGPGLGPESCSWFAGGMLAPWCESVDADPLVTKLGQEALQWWKKRVPSFVCAGSLVVAQGRDRPELLRFARRSSNHETLSAQALSRLEEDLGGRFGEALYFAQEAHMDPRSAMQALRDPLEERGGRVTYNTNAEHYDGEADRIVDCRGMGAAADLPDLRGIKGEMLLVYTKEVRLGRPIRLLHPRIPLYIVPRGEGLFMVGATMIECEDRKRITARSMIELLQGAYALHPAFAEAEVVEIGTDVRPAFPDNLPRIRKRGKRIYVNGLYRHGFLMSPTLAKWTKNVVISDAYYPEVMDEYPMQRSRNADTGNQLGERLA